MKKYLLSAVLLCAAWAPSFAQNTSDALRYSRVQNYGTARMAGVGGAFTALGADFGAISQNPAGLAMYRSTEFMFTPGVHFSATEAGLTSASGYDESSSKFRIANLGVVFNSRPSANSKWKTFNVGLGFNQLSNFNQSVYYEGNNTGGTILNGWFNEAEPFLASGGNPDNLYPLGPGLGYRAGAIYFQNGVPSYDFIDNPNANINRTHSVNTSGRNNEMTFGMAGNYDERLMIGASIGVPLINYRQDALYTERDPNGGFEGNVAYFDNLSYTDFLRTTGVGFNAKFGATLRLHQMFRIGGAIHSPTFLNMTDNFNADFEYAYQDLNSTGTSVINFSERADATADPFNYGLRTPWRASGGVAVLLSKYGFVSADVEWVDYAAAAFNLTKNQNDNGTRALERDLNAAIQRNFKAAANYRIGAELALDIFRLRAGYNLLGKPQANQTGFNTAWSAGVGIRFDKIFIDLAYRNSNATGSVSPYVGSGAPVATTDSNISDVLMTVGFKF